MTWAAFVYTGIRVQHKRWIAIGVAYLVITAALMATIALDDDGGSDLLVGVGTIGSFALWVGSASHSLVRRKEFMHRARLRDMTTDRHIERQVASELAVADPRLARTLGVGRPDQAGAEHGGVIDVNSVPADVLSRLPGLDDTLAHQAVEVRPFRSVEEMGSVLDLSPEAVEDLRERTIFVARS